MIKGLHLCLDLKKCNENMKDFNTIYRLLDELPVKIGMKKLLPPIIVNYKGDSETFDKDGGFSGFTIISTSHISIHCFDTTHNISVDVFSCKEFDKNIVLEHFLKAFKPENYEMQTIWREI